MKRFHSNVKINKLIEKINRRTVQQRTRHQTHMNDVVFARCCVKLMMSIK
jgi:hypothetical protein